MIEAERDVHMEGDATNAVIKGLHLSDLEENVIDQVQEMIDHEAFQGDVRIMPDMHVGSGATIGFTMPMNADPLRVSPNTIGVDIGCGMLAVNTDLAITERESDLSHIEETVRDEIPMSYHQHFDTSYHIVNDFPWETCNEKWERVKDQLGVEDPYWFDGYGKEYLTTLCKRVGYDMNDVISSMGTLGGGNHFVELASDNNDDYWFVLHSGSRGIGLQIAENWQEKATQFRTSDWIRSQLPEELEAYVVPEMDDPELTQWFKGGKGQSYIDSEAIKDAVSNNYLIGYLHDQIREAHPQHRKVNEDLDYLEGQEAAGYLVDMVFAQTYAWENRNRMVELILNTLDINETGRVHSPHNMIDFREPISDDHSEPVLRKGATRAHEGERFIVPLNMADGTLLCSGKGNPEWNMTGPHGAGRVMSRTQAFNEIDMDDFEESMADVYSNSVVDDTRDEAKFAYKDAALIKNAIKPTAEIVDHLEPVINWKATD